jgi:23S rRNA pseudouridine1911/1915/1917 synthase
MPQHILTVNEENHHTRLDIFLAKNIPDVPSRTFVKKLIDDGQVKVNQKSAKANYQVVTGDEIVVEVPEGVELWQDVQPEKIALDIFYEDPYFLVINKPAGMLVHPANRFSTGTLVNALLYHCKNLSDRNDGVFRPGIVHRLDRETSGLIIIAKDNRTHAILSRQFEKHKVRKKYVALVEGDIEFDEGVIDVPLGRHPRFFDKKTVSFDESGKAAKTVYRVLKRFKTKTFVALYPESGRTHQLRVHMAHLGHPILGDDKYGKKESFPRLALHAQSIGFFHPETKHFIEFVSTIPPEFKA